MTFEDRCAFCGTREGLTSVTRLEAGGMERVEWVCSLCLRLAERAAHMVPMTRHDMLTIRWMADHREQPRHSVFLVPGPVTDVLDRARVVEHDRRL